MKTYETNSPEETYALGRQLAGQVVLGDCISLIGDLGAGKTAFVRGLAEGLGADVHLVSSPTYVLVQEYPAAEMSLYHLDLYRMVDPQAELGDLGLDEMLANGVAVIEWADRAADALPISRTEIFIEITGPQSRKFSVKNNGTYLIV